MNALQRGLSEALERIKWAERILDDLASGYWREILNQHDDGKMPMGARVQDYWTRFSKQND